MFQGRKELALFTMGGTIDSRSAPEMDGEVVPLKESLVPHFLESLHLQIRFGVHPICMKDSRAITDGDRQALFDAIQAAGAKFNLVTHGTFTMPETARYLDARVRGKVVLLTGSMATMIGTTDERGRLIPSDAQFNLGFAIAEAFHAEDGVYVAMNGKLFPAGNVRKNIQAGVFESLETSK
jgi:L-asparaginase